DVMNVVPLWKYMEKVKTARERGALVPIEARYVWVNVGRRNYARVQVLVMEKPYSKPWYGAWLKGCLHLLPRSKAWTWEMRDLIKMYLNGREEALMTFSKWVGLVKEMIDDCLREYDRTGDDVSIALARELAKHLREVTTCRHCRVKVGSLGVKRARSDWFVFSYDESTEPFPYSLYNLLKHLKGNFVGRYWFIKVFRCGSIAMVRAGWRDIWRSGVGIYVRSSEVLRNNIHTVVSRFIQEYRNMWSDATEEEALNEVLYALNKLKDITPEISDAVTEVEAMRALMQILK
ncbi:MAG: hypothetical protein DRJ40_11620, partial [Thermoprotei archaeon]